MRALPSLNGLRAFEAAARLGSFTAAGQELNVSPAAVSRLVRLLEDRMAVPLFERTANKLRLTAAGRTYQAGLTPILDSIEGLTARVAATGKGPLLTIGVGPTFAVRWLIPRLSTFQTEHPKIDVRFATGGAAAGFHDDWSCGIKLSDGQHSGFATELLFAANLVPVCAPSVASKLKTPAKLKSGLLLRVAHAPDDWTRWFSSMGLAKIEAKGATFEYYGHAIQAAADGVGIAMGIRPYIDDDLAAGRLVVPFGDAVSKGMSWYLVYRPEQERDEAFQAFRNWISAEVQGR